MTAFSSYTDVQMIVSTDLSTTDITSLITLSDAWISDQTGVSSPSAGNQTNNFKTMSMLRTAILIKNKDPHAIAIGSYRETHYPIPIWQGELASMIKRYKTARVTTKDYLVDKMMDRWSE